MLCCSWFRKCTKSPSQTQGNSSETENSRKLENPAFAYEPELRVKAVFNHEPREADELRFQAGEILKILSEDRNGWKTAQRQSDGQRGSIPSSYVTTLGNDDDRQDWWFDVDKTKAEMLLLHDQNPAGAFLIRPHRASSQMLSVKYFDSTSSNPSTSHYIINYSNNGSCFIKDEKKFACLKELIRHYSDEAQDGLCHHLTAVCVSPRGSAGSNQQCTRASGANGNSSDLRSSSRNHESIGSDRERQRKVVASFDFHAIAPGDLEFKAGEILYATPSDDDWWFARHSVTDETGYIPSNYVSAMDDDYEIVYSWIFDIDRREAEMQLALPGNPRGTFLVRKSAKQEEGKQTLVLSVRDFEDSNREASIRHYKISIDQDGFCYLNEHRKFKELPELILHHKDAADGICHKLTEVCRRNPEQLPLKQFEVKREDLTLIEKLAEGNYGSVWRGTWKSKVDVAVKMMSNQTVGMGPEQFANEAKVLHKVRHRHLVTLLGVCTSHPVLIIMELVKNGNLKSYLQHNAPEMTNERLLNMACQIADGMSHLESINCIHRDLRADNVFVADNDFVKIGDVGLARFTTGVYLAMSALPLPARWTAPEALTFKFTTKSDVWSFGVLLYELFTLGKQPYEGMSNQDVMKNIRNGYRLPMPESSMNVTCPPRLYSLMKKCWRENPDERPTFAKLLDRLRFGVMTLIDDSIYDLLEYD